MIRAALAIDYKTNIVYSGLPNNKGIEIKFTTGDMEAKELIKAATQYLIDIYKELLSLV